MKTKLTANDEKDYVKKGFAHCPFCKSSDIDGESVNIDGKTAIQDIGCLNCGAQWTDVYKLTGIDVTFEPQKKDVR